ncbi:MAG: tryptophan--tRNA ligase [Hyphomonas sp.]|uniref:tryptophan--tRNA ligase n=1 Tax=Hyphomonas sp. TaxID=87 RepID=UPI003528D798
MTDTTAPAYSGPKRIFSGIQPTGNLHLGNYLGALKKFVDLQATEWETIYCVVDQHAITQAPDVWGGPELLASYTRQIAAAYLAAGIDPKRSIIFAQSAVREHTELAWVFNCVARMGWVERMTQFKDKAGKDAERASVGLFTYPVLMAADILLYKATHVPVGDDQKQHLELSRDIAERFNRDFNVPDFFPVPEPLIKGPGARIMSLKDGTKKMSKSDPSDLSRINLVDDSDTIAKKIKKATTDPLGPMPEDVKGLEGRPEVENLVGIYSAVSGESVEAVVAKYAGQGFGVFKPALAEVMVAHLAPITARYREIMDDPAEVDRVLRDGADRARAIAAPIMDEVRRTVGFWGA